MKKILTVLMIAVLLCGCGAQETFETVEDLMPVEAVASPRQFCISLPEEAASPTFREDDSVELYVCSGYTISKQITESGDWEKTLQEVTGKRSEELQILKTQTETCDRYDFGWTAAGEEGLQLGRACILDDGNFHYALSVMAEEETAGKLQPTIQEMFATCKLIDPQVNLHTGS